MAGELDLSWVDVNGDDPLASEGKLDSVTSNSTETINNDVTPDISDIGNLCPYSSN